MKIVNRVSPDTKCVFCNKETSIVYDTSIGGRWGYICPSCYGSEEPRIGTKLVTEESWQRRWPKVLEILKNATLSDAGKAYAAALDYSFIEYGDNGFATQLRYIANNCDKPSAFQLIEISDSI